MPALSHVEVRCPYCTTTFSAAVTPGDGPPCPGSTAMCGACCEISIFDQRLKLRRPTPEEQQIIGDAPHLAEMTLNWRNAQGIRWLN